MTRESLPPGYVEKCEELHALMRRHVVAHGLPSFTMSPDRVWAPAALDSCEPLAENASARALIAKAKGIDFTLMMLLAVLQVMGIPFVRAPSIRAFARRFDPKNELLVGIGVTDEGERDLIDAVTPKANRGN